MESDIQKGPIHKSNLSSTQKFCVSGRISDLDRLIDDWIWCGQSCIKVAPEMDLFLGKLWAIYKKL